MTRCPHCDEALPAVRDAFCPACRGDLIPDAPVPSAATPAATDNPVTEDSGRRLLWFLAGVALVAGGLLTLASFAGVVRIPTHLCVLVMSLATPLIALAEQNRPKPPEGGSALDKSAREGWREKGRATPVRAARREVDLTGSGRPG